MSSEPLKGLPADMREVSRQLKESPVYQEFRKTCFPKRVRYPHWVHDPELVVMPLLAHSMQISEARSILEANRSARQTFTAYAAWRDCGNPVYVVEPDCLDALMRTEIPDDIPLDTLNWPYDGFLLAFPRGSVPVGQGDEMTHAIVSTAHGMLIIHANLLSTATYAMAYPMEGFALSKAFANKIEINDTLPDGTRLCEKAGFDHLVDDPAIEQEMLRRCVSICLSALLLMNATPEEIVPGGNEKRVKKTKSDPRPWIDPHYLGRTFTRKKYNALSVTPRHVSTGGTIASHWRRGHWRNQPYGPREAPKYKVVWMRPCRVGTAEE